MRIGIDLDNTIICYDELFARLATERAILPPGTPCTKQAIRDYLREQGQEDCWTELQGIAYGSRIDEAVPFAGVAEFLRRCGEAKIDWWIISHRTRSPYLGEPVDLHVAAREWLRTQRLVADDEFDRVKLEISREAKLRRIVETECQVFIDDLPELLCDPSFPAAVRRILFDPNDQNPDRTEYERATSWSDVVTLLEI
jgi:hypothetical protein